MRYVSQFDGEEQVCFVAYELNRVLYHSLEEINVSDILQKVIRNRYNKPSNKQLHGKIKSRCRVAFPRMAYFYVE